MKYFCIFFYFQMRGTSGWFTGEYSWGCQPVDYSYNPNALRLLNAFYYLYLLKMVELIETVFFVLRKEIQPSDVVTFIPSLIYLHIGFRTRKIFRRRYVLNPSNAKQLYSRPDVYILLFFLLWTQMAKKTSTVEAQANHSPNGTIYNNSYPFNYCYYRLMRGTEELLVHLGPKRLVVTYKMFYDFYKNSYHTKQKSNASNNNIKKIPKLRYRKILISTNDY
ncbi:hypothetical protein NQ317_006982 [Molorchus minor]|uniref:Very-long-chain 3-oxoacyl-CoA synthase n=1 Tax=Molorchus minor TaxID=1323400 RepID=A0ABQ9ISV7_9CUCU|nr:hypothetical protein NQ317_006982 [Molorchus minor]